METNDFVVRFGVYDDPTKKRSTTWRVWVSNSKTSPKSDVYIAARPLGKYQKISLHESGDWRDAFLTEGIAINVPTIGKPRTSRIIRKWTEPAQVGAGVILAYRIVIPTSELRKFGNKDEEVTWILAPEEDFITEFDIVFTEPDAKVTGWPGKNVGTKLIDKSLLPNKRILWILYRYEKITEKLKVNIEKHKKKIPESVIDSINNEKTDENVSFRAAIGSFNQR